MTIDLEKKQLDNITFSLNQKKIDIREIQEQLKKEQDQYKLEYNAFKNAPARSSTK